MSGRETAELLLLMGRLVQADGYRGDLSPAQWMALRFFARANQFSRNPSAFAEFQATTRGTASQVIKVLEAGGYLIRKRSEVDGRRVGLRLTDKGKEAIARDPFEALVRAVDSLTRRSKPRCTAPCVAWRVGNIDTSVFARTASISSARPGRLSNACCSAFRLSRRTLVSSASTFRRKSEHREDRYRE